MKKQDLSDGSKNGDTPIKFKGEIVSAFQAQRIIFWQEG